jgi:predicted O-linked N-acetylglucosamine transferase (SPINDLY family)
MDQLQCARAFVADQGTFPALWNAEIYHHDRIRVAYVSADFGDHPVSQLTVGLFEQHDKSRFEITGISFRPHQDSAMQRRLYGAFERFVHVTDKSDWEIADLLRRLEIDIVVDLTGFTQRNRLNVLARRAAPIQVSYLGYAGTMGAGYIDYIIADSIVIPKDHFPFYDEQVVWLPNSYLANDNKHPISGPKPTRSECGLPETAFVFCYFNNPYKITPEMFHVWTSLLKAVSNSILWLGGANPAAQANLRCEAERRDVPAKRLIFAPRLPVFADHLARHQQADLFLDTLPYNAHATARDALWAGVPLVTCLGSTFASRVAGSLLRAVGLDELITHSLEDYEAMALQLAKEPSRLAALKDRLARNRNTHPLFDTKRFARHIEAAFLTMWERYQRGERPEAFTVIPP